MRTHNFTERHNGPRETDVDHMLSVIGLSSIEQLIDNTIPSSIRIKGELDLPEALTETRFLDHMKDLGRKNKT